MRTVWLEGTTVCLIDQTLLPFKFKIFRSKDYQTTCKAIKTMIVRGAGAIGATAGFAMYQAIAAKHYNIPFYVAAPTSTFDLNCASGSDIPIEERSGDEVLYQSGKNLKGKIENILVCCPRSTVVNPAFDVTPAKLITAIITEKGIIRPSRAAISKLF